MTVVTGTRDRTHKPPLARRIRRELSYHLMVWPGIAFFLIFAFYPMIGIAMAFQNYMLGQRCDRQPLGGDAAVYVAVRRQGRSGTRCATRCAYPQSTLRSGFGCRLSLRCLLNEIRLIPYKRVLQTFSYLPHFISWVIVASIMTFWLGTDFQGIINIVLVKLHIIEKPIPFLTYREYYYAIAVISNIWKSMGWGSIIYLAAISTVDQEIYEAATVDGAGRLRKIWNITLPSIRPTMAIMLILAVGGIFRGSFDQSYLLKNSFNMSTSDILETYVLRYGISLARYSLATAAGLFQSAVNLLLVLVVNFVVRTLDSEQGPVLIRIPGGRFL